MAWNDSGRKERLPANWEAIRKQVLKRDNYECQFFFADGAPCDRKATDVDHIHSSEDHRLSNLRSLCSWHHAKRTAIQGYQAKAKAKAAHSKRFRRTEAHPFLLRRTKG